MPHPFVATTNLRPGSGLSVPFPPQTWLQKISDYADRSVVSKVLPGKHEKEVSRMRRQFTQTLNGLNGGNADALAQTLATQLNAAMQLGYQSTKQSRQEALGTNADPESGRVMRGVMVVQALLNSNPQWNTPQGREVLAKALAQVSEQDRVALMRADEACGKKIYSAAYLAKKDNPNAHGPLFSDAKASAQFGAVQRQLDEMDPTGQASQVLRKFQDHLQTTGVSAQDQKVFLDKLAFKMTLRSNQGQHPDIPAPDTTVAGWQDDMTAALARTFAEAGVTDDGVTRMLNMDADAKARLLAHAASGSKEDQTHVHAFRREGDFRIMKAIQHQGRQAPTNSDAAKLGQMADGLEKGTLNRNVALQQAKAGSSLANMQTRLQQERQQYENALAGRINARLQKVHTGVDKQILNLEHNARLKDPNVVNKGVQPPDFKDSNDDLARVNRGLKELRDFKRDFPNPPTLTNDQARNLLERFGRGPLEPMTATENVNTSNLSLGFSDITNRARQLNMHLDALADPRKLEQGLQKMILTTPTAGRALQDCAWVDSTARDLVATARAIKAQNPNFSLRDHPIIIFDQTDGDGTNQARMNKFHANAQYLQQLEQQYQDVGLTFKHVSMQQVKAMTQGSGVEKLFDTTGENMAGYGGGRNIAFLLGPVVQYAHQNNIPLDQIRPDQIQSLIAEHAMSEGSRKVFMGDDTDYVAPGMTANIATLAQAPEYEDQYTLHSPLRGGRDTQSVAPLAANSAHQTLGTNGYDSMVSGLFACNKWNERNTRPGMGCTFGSPRFCLDLPTGKEETHNDATRAVPNFFGQAFHLSGDRQNSPSEQLKANMAYTNLTAMVGKIWNNSSLPWNTEAKQKISSGSPLNSLAEVMEIAGDQGKQQEFARSFFNNLVDWRNDANKNDGIRPLEDPAYKTVVSDYLNQHPELDAETRDELLKVQEVYTDGHQQALHVNTLIDRTIANLKNEPGNNGLDPKDPNFKLDKLGDALQRARQSMSNDGVVISQTSNRMVRDVYLVINTVGAGSFQGMAHQLHGAHQQLGVQQHLNQNVGGPIVQDQNQVLPNQSPQLKKENDDSVLQKDGEKPSVKEKDLEPKLEGEKGKRSVEKIGPDGDGQKLDQEESFQKLTMSDRIRKWESRGQPSEKSPGVKKDDLHSEGTKVKDALKRGPSPKHDQGTHIKHHQ